MTMIMPKIDDIIKEAKIHKSKVKCIYLYGSRVYGTENENSDWDFIMIANNSVPNVEIKGDNYNIHIITPDEFKMMLKIHHPGAIECFFSEPHCRLLETVDWDFELKISSLRHMYSHVSSNSWVKCKKKLEQDDYYIGIKSLFHSLRIVMFGIQLATENKISDFKCANHIFDKIMSKKWTWNELDNEFRSLKNELNSKFKMVTYK
jgi:predicted nucleotidyltransferase